MNQKVEELHQEFIDISKLIKNELDRFDKEKVEDFRDSVEQFLKSMIEHQKEVKKNHYKGEGRVFLNHFIDYCVVGNLF
jgi:hypothetical protein